MRALLLTISLSVSLPALAQQTSTGPEAFLEHIKGKRLARSSARTASLEAAAGKAASAVNRQDSLALVAVYNATGGASWNDNSGWLAGEVRTWHGVRVSGDRVVGLDLSSNNLTGSLPSDIGNLTALQDLDLSDFFEEANFLTGPIPESIGNLVQLQVLDLDGNLLSGSIPSSVGNLLQLTDLRLGRNALTGPIPSTIGQLSQLEQLLLGTNQLSGQLPESLGNLSLLEELELGLFGEGNLVEGPIPPSFGNLSALEDLLMSTNRLNGSIPSELGQLANLQTLSLSGNRLSGELPSSIGNLSNLLLLDLGIKAVGQNQQGQTVGVDLANNLTGEIPASIAGMPNLAVAYLANNAFTGALPAAFGSSQVQSLWLNCNRLEGLPDLSGMPNILDLRVDENRLTFEDLEPNVGVVPAFIYFPQAAVDLTVSAAGSSTVLSVAVGGSQNAYQWYLDGAAIAGAAQASYTIPAGSPADASRYEARITNPTVPNLVLTTEPLLEQLVVNDAGDGSDSDLADGNCDANSTLAGNQCTLRAALEIAEAEGGGSCACDFRITFSGVTSISPSTDLPEIASRLEMVGVGNVEIDGGSSSGDGLRITGGAVEISGMAVEAFGGYGIRISGGGGHVITGSSIGGSVLNDLGGIRVEGGTIGVRIGGMTEAEENEIGSGVSVVGTTTRGVSVLRNNIRVPTAWVDSGGRVPVDQHENGPTCVAWDPAGNPPGPNLLAPAPRILELTGDSVGGISTPGATVVVYEVVASGNARGRYWPSEVNAVAIALADGSGAWSTALTGVSSGSRIVVGSVDASGNASELTQARYPVIFIPGVGGVWLMAEDRTKLFISLATAPDFVIRNRLDRLRMKADGSAQLNGERVIADEILEGTLAGQALPYDEVIRNIQDAGYPGRPFNTQAATLDLWRFAYDWRLSSPVMANDLAAMVERITAASGQAEEALSCLVDIVTHSNGGMVASSYVLGHRQHSQNKVRRLLMNAAPYWGSAQVAKAHTAGYLFDIDQTPYAGPDLDWGRMTRLFLNLPNGYGLLPSRTYMQAIQPGVFNQQSYYLSDMQGRFLIGYDETFRFMTADKLNAVGKPDGLGRNGPMWTAQQNTLHDLVNNWRSYEGPPQVFRHVGRVNASTAMTWTVPTTLTAKWSTIGSYYNEEGDTNLHVAYRETISPQLGWGDGTVPLISATLGRGTTPGGESLAIADFSGVDQSPWIEEFEYFECLHVPMVSSSCPANDQGDTPLGRMSEILRFGSEVPPATGRPASRSVGAVDTPREVLYIQSATRILVWVEDEQGNRTGPAAESTPNAMLDELPDVTYEVGPGGGAVSVPSSRAFTFTVKASGGPADVRVTRAALSGDSGTQVLFARQSLSDGGTLVFRTERGATSLDTGLSVDADGDGAAETTAAPGLQIMDATNGLAVPTVSPSLVSVSVPSGQADPVETVRLAAAGAGTWAWRLEGVPAWMAPSSTSGGTPASVQLTLGAAALGEGYHEDSLSVVFSREGFEERVLIRADLAVTGAASILSSIQLLPDHANLVPGDSARFWTTAFDQYEQAVTFSADWEATGGTITEDGLYVAGETTGEYEVTVRDPGTGISASAAIRIVSGVAVEGEPIPGEYFLAQNYPNPFNPVTTVRFGLPSDVLVHLEVYDLLGRRVAVLIGDRLPAGVYERRIDAGSWPSGAYILRMQAAGFVETRVIHVLK